MQIDMHVLDSRFTYGCEFLGISSLTRSIPLMERSFISIAQTIGQLRGCLVTGVNCSGRTETVKVRLRKLVYKITNKLIN